MIAREVKRKKLVKKYAAKRKSLLDEFNADNLSNLSSGTSTVAILGSIVQNGKFLASIFCDVSKLKIDDLPTFGMPTKPHLNPITGTIYVVHEVCVISGNNIL